MTEHYYAEGEKVFERSGDVAGCIAHGNSPEVAQLIALALNEQADNGTTKRALAAIHLGVLAGDLKQLAARADRMCSMEKGAGPV